MYKTETTDLLLRRNLPKSTGYLFILSNVGATETRGLEVTLNANIINSTSGFTWDADFNLGHYKEEIVDLAQRDADGNKADDTGNQWFIGHPIEVHYEYEFDGIWQLEEADAAEGFDRRPGDIKVVDHDDSGSVNADGDRVILGRHPDFPKWTGSLSNRLEFRGIDLSALATARWGYLVDTNTWPGQMSSRYNQPKMNYWTPENPSNEFPRPNLDSEGAVDAGAVQIMEGSHWRIRNITLGYTLPSNLTGQLREGSSLRVYLQAQDPFVFTDFPGFDPEGGENTGVPSYRTLLLGASVGF